MVFAFGKSGFCATITAKEDTSFSISVGYYNHAEMLFNGEKVIRVEHGVLCVQKLEMLTNKVTILFRANLGSASFNRIRDIRLDTLGAYYNNRCVLATSGDEYSVCINSKSVKKKIHLHHYYHPQVERLIDELGKHLPKELRMAYLSSDNEQNCDD